MKIAVALLLCIALPATFAMFAASINDDLHKLEEACSKESGASLDDINMVRKNKVVPDNDRMNKWAMCMMIEHNVMNRDGIVNMDAQTVKIPADTDSVLMAFEKCKSRTGRDMENTAREMMNCYMQEHQIVMALTMLKST